MILWWAVRYRGEYQIASIFRKSSHGRITTRLSARHPKKARRQGFGLQAKQLKYARATSLLAPRHQMSVHHTHFLPRPGVSGEMHSCLKGWYQPLVPLCRLRSRRKLSKPPKSSLRTACHVCCMMLHVLYGFCLSELQKVVPSPTFGDNMYPLTVH